MKPCKVCGGQYEEGKWAEHSRTLAHVRGSGRRKIVQDWCGFSSK